MKQTHNAGVKVFPPRIFEQDRVVKPVDEAAARNRARIENFKHEFRRFRAAHRYE